jgi:hypothetical protein
MWQVRALEINNPSLDKFRRVSPHSDLQTTSRTCVASKQKIVDLRMTHAAA